MPTRRAWLAASIAAGVFSVLIAASGGFVASVGGVRISARSWYPAAAVALAAALAWLWLASRARAVAEDLEALHRWVAARGIAVSRAMALMVVAAGLVLASYSASGSDASGYLSQAAMWAGGQTRLVDPLVQLPGWPLAAADTAPLGWRPALEGGWQVPTYAPGLPWLMAIPHRLAGLPGAMALVVVSAGAAVWAVSALAARLGGGAAAIISGVLVATSPTFQYQTLQPMSDVPVTAAWALSWLRAGAGSPIGVGVWSALAVLIRPNLAPLAVVPLCVLVLTRPRQAMRRNLLVAGAPIGLAGALIALVQWKWYGSPLRSGYGSAGELFALGNVPANTRLYASWLWEAEPAFAITIVLLVLVTISRIARSPADRPTRQGLIVFAAGVVAAYLIYAVFEVWSYLRFMLPALAAIAVVAAVAIDRALSRLPQSWCGVALVAISTLVLGVGVQRARTLGVYRVADVQSRAREVGEVLARTLPANAVLIAGEQSGSMRYATGRPIVRWEPLDAVSLVETLRVLDANGYEAWWVLDQFEEAGVRARFSAVPAAALDWPPAAQGGRVMLTRAWRIAEK